MRKSNVKDDTGTLDTKLEYVSIDLLRPFSRHPYKVRDDEAMHDMAESVKQYGVLTRIIPMHGGKSVASALKLRTDYAMNPDKTENGKLISAFACDPHTADAEFLLSKRQYRQFTGREQRSDVIAYQVRQSFKPGEITPEEANRIGVEFAERFLKGKHAYIVCTHTDRRHIHNHIIFNSTTLDCRGKFDNFWGSSRAVRALSDTLCIEHGLSVVETPKRRGKSYNKWLAEQKPSLLIDIQAKLSEGKGAGYERWAKVFNLKQMAQTINFLKENGDMDFDELSRRAEAASEKCSVLTEKLKATEARMSEVEELKKHVINYLRTRDIFRAYKDSGYQSGSFDSKSRHVSKRGSPHLRRVLFVIMSMTLIRANTANPVFCFMDKKRAEGKHFYVYTVAGSAKFLRIYYAKVKEYLNALEDTA